MYIEEDYGASGVENLVEGYGFSKNSNVDIVWDLDGPTETLLGTATTDADGYFEYTVTIPDEANGEYTITATDENGNSDHAFFEIIEPQLDIQYDEGIIGLVNGIQGFAFSPLSNITLIWDANGPTEVELGTTATTANGRFLTNYTVPNAVPGTYNITAIDENLKEASIEFEVIPFIIQLNATSGTVGSQVNVTGQGFAANSLISLTLNGTEIATTTANVNGTFTKIITIPNVSTGYYLIAAEDNANQQYSREFTIRPSITVDRTQGVAGTVVSANGTGWAASTAFSLHLSPNALGVKVVESITDENG